MTPAPVADPEDPFAEDLAPVAPAIPWEELAQQLAAARGVSVERTRHFIALRRYYLGNRWAEVQTRGSLALALRKQAAACTDQVAV